MTLTAHVSSFENFGSLPNKKGFQITESPFCFIGLGTCSSSSPGRGSKGPTGL